MRNCIRFTAAFALLAAALSSFGGSILWRQSFDGGAPDEGMGIKTDAAGHARVAWMTYFPPQAWLRVAKLNAEGQEQWRVSLPVANARPPKSGSCAIQVVGEDTYVFCSEDSAERSAFLARLLADGTVAWTASVTDISKHPFFESDASGVYLAGTNSTGQLELLKFNQAGLAWSLLLSNTVATGRIIRPNQLVIANDVLVTGWQETDEIDFDSRQVRVAFALRCTVEGTVHWLRTITSTNRLNTFGSAIAQTADGSIIMGGSQSLNSTNGITQFADNLFVRFNAEGTELVRTAIPRAGIPNKLVPLASGDVLTLTTGFFPGERRIARLTADGVVQWIRGRRSAQVFRLLEGERFLMGGYSGGPFLMEVDAATGRTRQKLLPVPRGASRNSAERRDFDFDLQGSLYFLTGDGTPWPDVTLVKYRPLSR